MPKKERRKRKCSCCGSEDLKVKYRNMTDKSYHINGSFTLLKCKKCGLEMTHPLLSEKEATKYYPTDKYYSFKNISKLPLTYHKLSAYYHSKKNPIFNLFFYPFSFLFYTYYIDPNKKLLEIGCGDGLKLKIYQKYGVKTTGIEPYGSELSKEEEKLGIRREFIKNVNFPENYFDYIVLKEVLEHIPNQKQVLKKCYKWLKPNGKLIITIPNTQGFWCKVFREDWFGYDITRHPYHYNSKNIAYFLKKMGFKINKIRTYDPPYMLAGSLKYKYNSEMWLSPFFKILFTPLGLIVTYLNKGSLMEIECTK